MTSSPSGLHGDLYQLAMVYDAMFSWDPSDEAQYLLSLLERYSPISRSAAALDIGCGTGRVAAALRRRGVDVQCLDLSPAMSSYAHRTRGLDAVNAAMQVLPLRSTSMHMAYSMLAVINHAASLESLSHHLREAQRVLKRGGIYVADLVVETPGCIGVCEEWSTLYRGKECTARYIVESLSLIHI